MRMLVFPYGHDCEPIIRYADMLDSCYEIAALVSPGGWGLAGKNILLKGSKMTLLVHESLQEVTEEFDSLFIPAFEVSDEEVENRLIEEMEKLIPRLSNIICAARLTDVNRKKLKKVCHQTNPSCIFMDFSEYKDPNAYGLMPPTEKYPSLQLLDIPVIVVAGLWEKTDKFEISLALRKRFLQNGYHVSQIGSRDGCEMMGFHSFPGFMFRKDVDAADKIIYFNHWIWQMAQEEQPDLLLITIPGATQDFNEKFTRGFGLLHHQVFQAALPDALVMCTFYMPDSTEALKEISMFCKYRFGAPVDVFHMSNLFIDVNDSQERNRIVTNSIYRETVSEAIKKGFSNSSIHVFNGLDSVNCDRMFDVLIEKLIPRDVQAVL